MSTNIKLIYGRICHAIWFLMPDRIALGTKLGRYILSWAGYWANTTKRSAEKARQNQPQVTAEQAREQVERVKAGSKMGPSWGAKK